MGSGVYEHKLTAGWATYSGLSSYSKSKLLGLYRLAADDPAKHALLFVAIPCT